MTGSMPQPTIAILVANGFEENHITAVQRSLTKEGIAFKIIAPEQGLANGWQNNAWGHYFTVDENLSTAMGSDYDFLILVGGERGIAKLKGNPHTRRIVNHFLEAEKPISAIECGVSLLALSPKSAGLTVASTDAIKAELIEAKIEPAAEAQVTDRVVLTSSGADIDAWVATTIDLIAQCPCEEAVAA